MPKDSALPGIDASNIREQAIAPGMRIYHGRMEPDPITEQEAPARRDPCQCVSCVQGRAKALANLFPGVDLVERLSDALLSISDDDLATLKRILQLP